MQRDVAQLGSAPLWGSGGLGFKSQHSDFIKIISGSWFRHEPLIV